MSHSVHGRGTEKQALEDGDIYREHYSWVLCVLNAKLCDPGALGMGVNCTGAGWPAG